MEPDIKFVPVTVIVISGLPEVASLGVNEVIVGPVNEVIVNGTCPDVEPLGFVTLTWTIPGFVR